MAKNKCSINVKGFEEYANKLNKFQKELIVATEKALQKSQSIITPKIEKDMNRHKRTGATKKSIIKDQKVEWKGATASIRVGFKISQGGLPSIFLMYGTPRVPKDQKLYDDIYGNKTKNQIFEVQKKIIKKTIKK